MHAWLLQGAIMTVCGLLFGLILRGVASRGLHAPYRGFSLKTVVQITIMVTLGATFLPRRDRRRGLLLRLGTGWCVGSALGWVFAHSIELRGGVVSTHRKPPEVRICRLRNQSVVGTRPPSTSTPHCPACLARR